VIAKRWLAAALVMVCVALPACAQKEKRHMAPIPESARPAVTSAHSTAEAGLPPKRRPADTLPDLEAMQMNGVKAPVAHAASHGGSSATSASDKRKGHWLLLYRRENCVPCDALQNALAASASPQMDGGRPYVIVVANKGDTHGGNRLDALRARYSTMSNATWMEDSKGAMIAALKPRGTPMLYAMSGNRIAWSVPGALGDPAMVEHMAAAWLASSDPQMGEPADPAASPTANVAPPATARALRSSSTAAHNTSAPAPANRHGPIRSGANRHAPAAASQHAPQS